jgi:hypothetical protein
MPQERTIPISMRIDPSKQRRNQQPDHQCNRYPVNKSTCIEDASGKTSLLRAAASHVSATA